jgi:hypothetical protein
VINLEPVAGGFRLKTQDGHHLEVRPQLRLFRLREVPVVEPRDVARFWCYSTFEAAVLAGAAWEVCAETEPVGWIRRGGAR